MNAFRGRTRSSGSWAERGYTVVLTARGVATLVGLVVACLIGTMVVERCGPVFVILGLALVEVVLVEPAFRWLGRRLPRALALAIVVIGALVLTAATLALLTWEVDRQAGAISTALSDSVASLEPGSTEATVAEHLGLAERSGELVDGVAARLVIRGDSVLSGVALFGQVILISVLAGFMMSGADRLTDGVIRRMRRASSRERAHRLVAAVHRDAGRFARRTVVVGVAHGAAAGVGCWLLDVPGAVGLGFWVGTVVVVPIAGPLLAWAPVVAVASVGDGSVLVVLLLAVALSIVDRMVRRRWVDRALRLGPLLVLIAICLGHYASGVPGAAIAVVVTAMLAAAARAQRSDVADRAVEVIEDRTDGDGIAPVDVTAQERDGEAVVRLRFSSRTVLVLIVVVVGASAALHVVDQTGSFLVWAAIAAFICFGLDRPVSATGRWLRLPRWAAVTVVLGAFAMSIGGVVALAGPSIVDSATSIVDDAPRTITSLEGLPVVGRVLRDRDASQQIEDFVASIPERIEDSELVGRVLTTAGDGLIGALLVVSILLAALLDVPRLATATSRRVPVRYRRRTNDVASAVSRAVSRAAAASAFVATLNGLVVMLLALALDIPIAVVLGIWSAGWNFIPQIGGFVGAFPLVALGFGQGTTQGLVALVLFVTYQTFENHVLQPLVGARAIRVPPLVGLSVALVGGALAGFVGALLAGPVLAMVKGAMLELRGDPEPRIEDRPPGDRAAPPFDALDAGEPPEAAGARLETA